MHLIALARVAIPYSSGLVFLPDPDEVRDLLFER